ncbi:MAG: gamma-glutamyl-gamma-aminobutyrate hydrolase [Pelagibacterales bacterium]|nr:gamma-glutamyl-gamma-aminobutyrate hydrolase [Pelagibacterales bacterium]
MMSKKPLIGLTLDLETNKTYSKFPWYALRENYCSSISNFGGVPIPIVYDNKSINSILDVIDGLVITGGAFDVDPKYYSEKKKYQNLNTKSSRTMFEINICKLALKKNIPVLGICGGQQLINIVYGGSLYQDIKKDLATNLEHEQKNPRNEVSHSVNLNTKSILYEIIKEKTIRVNSAHHQSIKTPGKGLVINAIASDGVIEGIEDQSKSFCIGVQWHPEFLIKKSDNKIFKSFIKATKGREKL